MAKLIAFEGPDCLGKTTQVELVAQELRKQGRSVSTYKIPWTEGSSYSLISSMLSEGTVLDCPYTFQMAMIENRRDFQNNILASETSELVIVDRWNLSTLLNGNRKSFMQHHL